MELCNYCGEPLERFDRLVVQNHHRECQFRMVAGSVAHIEERCSCFVPGSEKGDPPRMTKREAARAAVKAWRKRNGLVRSKPNGEDLCRG